MEAFEQVIYEALYDVMDQAWEQTEAEFSAQHGAADQADSHV